MHEQLLAKITNKDAILAVVGMGYVGLPLAVEMAKAGFQVTGIDVEPEKVKLLNKGSSYIQDIPTEDLFKLVENGYIQGTLDFSVLKTADAVSICVPTPLRKTKDPDISYIISVTEPLLQTSHHIIVQQFDLNVNKYGFLDSYLNFYFIISGLELRGTRTKGPE